MLEIYKYIVEISNALYGLRARGEITGDAYVELKGRVDTLYAAVVEVSSNAGDIRR